MDGAPTDDPATSAVVLAFGDEPDLPDCLAALRANGPAGLEVVVVDNGCSRTDLDELVAAHDARLVRPIENGGFAGGCNDGASAARGETLVFVNSDALIEPGCIEALADTVSDPEVGLASGLVLLDDQPDVVNSVGNPVHVCGLSWAGGYGEPAADHATGRTVASASGCALAVRRETWEQLGGFWRPLFAYLEDTELSLRCHQLGLDVRYVPTARVRHRYEFGRNELKSYLLERNRLLVLLTLHERRTLLRLAPVLLVFELLMLALAARQGWLRQKVRGYEWVIRHRTEIRARRRLVQAQRRRGDDATITRCTTVMDPANVPLPPGLGALNALVTAWCRLVGIGRPAAASGQP